MTGKLVKTTRIVELDIPFDPKRYAGWAIAGVAMALVAGLITAIPLIGATGWLLLALAYFVPALVAFDVMEVYKSRYGIAKIPNPNRYLVLWGNLFFGFTVVGWLAALYFALKVGRTTVEVTEYAEA